MKKTPYIAPALLTVELGMRCAMMLTASDEKGTVIPDDGEGDGTDIGVKGISSHNLWDEEW